MIEIIQQKIRRNDTNANSDYIKKKAELYKQIYTGQNDYDLLTSYRERESEAQKKQRDRITIRRTVAVCHQVEHTLDKLQTLDKAVNNISAKTKEDELKEYVYNENISKVAFNYIKHYNIVDPNAFIIAGINEFGEKEFEAVTSASVIDFKIKNDRLIYLVIKEKKGFKVYLDDGVYDLDEKANIVNVTQTGKNYAFHVGYILDAETKFKTFKSIIASAEQQFKQLLWDGSEYDIIKALHGIIKQFAYAQPCVYARETDDGIEKCEHGTVYLGENPKGQCPACKGSGLRIHASSQDVVYLPEPLDNSGLKLTDLTHTVFIPDSILQTRKDDIQELEDKIIRTVFNANRISQNDREKTAYEVKTENSGLIAQFYKLGEKVSDTFIWMVEVVADMIGAKDVKVFHGYSMDLNVDTLEELFTQRKQAVDSGTTNEVIAGIDTAILKKQHMDNPDYINQVLLWESFKPFRTLSQQEKIMAIGDTNVPIEDKILWLNWDRIKSNILFKYEDFYQKTRNEQTAIFNEEVKLIKDSLPETMRSIF